MGEEGVDGAMFADSAEPLILSRDAEPLRRVIEERSATVVYVDALFSHLDLEGEGRMSQQMRRALSPWSPWRARRAPR